GPTPISASASLILAFRRSACSGRPDAAPAARRATSAAASPTAPGLGRGRFVSECKRGLRACVNPRHTPPAFSPRFRGFLASARMLLSCLTSPLPKSAQECRRVALTAESREIPLGLTPVCLYL